MSKCTVEKDRQRETGRQRERERESYYNPQEAMVLSLMRSTVSTAMQYTMAFL